MPDDVADVVPPLASWASEIPKRCASASLLAPDDFLVSRAPSFLGDAIENNVSGSAANCGSAAGSAVVEEVALFFPPPRGGSSSSTPIHGGFWRLFLRGDVPFLRGDLRVRVGDFGNKATPAVGRMGACSSMWAGSHGPDGEVTTTRDGDLPKFDRTAFFRTDLGLRGASCRSAVASAGRESAQRVDGEGTRTTGAGGDVVCGEKARTALPNSTRRPL